MSGRELVPVTAEVLAREERDRLARAVRAVRTRHPLRKRLAEEGERLRHLRERLLAAVRAGDDDVTAAALRDVPLDGGTGIRSAAGLAAAVGVLHGVAGDSGSLPVEFAEVVDRFGPGPAAAALHLAEPASFPPTSPALVRSATAFDDALTDGLSAADGYRLSVSLLRHLRERHRVHPFEFADVVTALAKDREEDDPPGRAAFGGFCTDTFRFFGDLTGENNRTWMLAARPRYEFAVREPLVELCTALAGRYIGPVLAGEYGWDVESEPRPGKALTSICKNDYGRSAPYQPTLWLTFYPRAAGSRRQAAQFFVRADPDGLRYGFHLGPHARAAGRRFRQNVQRHADPLHRALAATDAPDAVTFAADAALGAPCPLRSPEDLRAWAAGKTLAAGRFRPAADPLLRREELVG
jgi:uncharacterized protein (DUF2461 family)